MVVLYIHMLVDLRDWRVRIALVDFAVGIACPGAEIWRWLVELKTNLEVCGHDTHSHIVDSPLWDGAVDNGDS